MQNSKSWLDLAEKEHAQEVADRDAASAELALDLNTRLAELGLTPITPASADGRGDLVPAQLTAAVWDSRIYPVYADWDEDEHALILLVGDYRGEGCKEFVGLRETGLEISCRDDAVTARRYIVRARREGPFKPSLADGPSADAQAIAKAIRDLAAVVDNLAQIVARP